MPDIIDATGLTVDTAAEITAQLVAGLQSIYGNDINVDQNSPDGQVVGIITQEAVDVREIAVALNSSFDPDQAVGVLLDQRVAINNIERLGGTYTLQSVDVTTNATVTLQGLDAAFFDPNGTGYTVQDASGNRFILVDTNVLTAGTTTLIFRAQQIGNVSVPINTITIPVTVILGVTGVNNSSAPLSVGANQETDPQLRTRRSRSVALSSNGYLNGLLGFVLGINGVTEAVLYENVTNITDVNSIPAHGIWLVVAGGAHSEIGRAIYDRKSYGANMKGAVEYDITTLNGDIFTAKFDRPVAEDLYIRFDIQPTVSGSAFDEAAIKAYIVDNLIYGIGQFAETSSVTAVAVSAINATGGGGVPVNVEISDDGISWFDFLETSTLDKEFTLDASRITTTVL